MKRRVALRLTGKYSSPYWMYIAGNDTFVGQLFQMRQNVNLSSNVLDVPELFWSEASLKGLYDAVREYLEVDKRVKSLNEKLAGIGDLVCLLSKSRWSWMLIRYVARRDSRSLEQRRYGADYAHHHLVCVPDPS